MKSDSVCSSSTEMSTRNVQLSHKCLIWTCDIKQVFKWKATPHNTDGNTTNNTQSKHTGPTSGNHDYPHRNERKHQPSFFSQHVPCHQKNLDLKVAQDKRLLGNRCTTLSGVLRQYLQWWKISDVHEAKRVGSVLKRSRPGTLCSQRKNTGSFAL